MRMPKTLFVATLLLAVLSLSLAAADNPPAPAPAKGAAPAETAIFKVVGLDKGALVKDLSKAVSETPGVLSAKADKEKGEFAVTFETGKTTPEQILKSLTKVSPNAKFDRVAPADEKAAAKHDCGKCPSKATCGKKK